MLTRTTRVQLLAFVVIAVLGIVYLSVRYLGVGRWVGASGYTVSADLTDAGGIFTNAEVDYRGVPVGRVGDISLTADGIRIKLNIDTDRKIPADVKATVADRSVIGEQYVMLKPKTNDGPYLHDGSLITRSDTAIPPPIQDLLSASDALARSVPLASLQTVVGELYNATDNLGTNLSQLLASSTRFFSRADVDLPQTIDLINTSKTVLATQNQQSAQIRSFSQSLSLIGAQLKASDGDVSKVLSRTTGAATQFGGLIHDVRNTLSGLLTNLLTTSLVFSKGQNGLRETLVNYPVAVSIGGKVITPNGINVGLVPTFFDPLPCTSGYGKTDMRSGTDTKGNPGLNLSAGCTQPASDGNVRGTQNAPKAGS